jgi:hypothetical protein
MNSESSSIEVIRQTRTFSAAVIVLAAIALSLVPALLWSVGEFISTRCLTLVALILSPLI